MAEEGVMGYTDKNGTKINTYVRNSKKKMLQRSNALKILGGWRGGGIMFSQRDMHRKLSIKGKSRINFFFQFLNVKKIIPMHFF